MKSRFQKKFIWEFSLLRQLVLEMAKDSGLVEYEWNTRFSGADIDDISKRYGAHKRKEKKGRGK